jgi:hypothetical protein
MPLAVIIKAGTSLASLLAVASAGLVLFFFCASLPGARPDREEVAAEQALRERRGRGINPMPRPAAEGTGTAAQLVAAGSTEGAPQMASVASSPPKNASTPMPAPAQPTMSMSIAAGVASNMDIPAAGLSMSDPLPSHPPAVPGSVADGLQAGVSATATRPAATPVLARPSPTLSNDAERFVPVVFTHKDRGTVLRAFARLQRQFPKLMAHRQSELQLVDTGKNGIWYRLIVLPAGPHQEALQTCGHLEASGYNRCWVKPY